MTVGEMLQRISSTELAEWTVYERLYGPLGPSRHDQLVALLASTIANVNRPKRGRRYRPSDFMPRWGGRERQSPREQLGILEQLVRRAGGTIRKGTDDDDR